MISRRANRADWAFGFVFFFALTLAGCGGDGGSGSVVLPVASGTPPSPVVNAVPTGTITIAFSDGPASDEFSQALMVIRRVRLMSAEPDAHHVVLAVSPETAGLLPLTIDLLQITSFSETLLELEVPVNTLYSAVELWVESLTMVRPDGSVESVVLDDNGSSDVSWGVTISANFIYNDNDNANSDVIELSESEADGRQLVNVEVPLDLALQREADGVYHLRPLAILSKPNGMLLRVAGNVGEVIEPEARYPSGAFKLCELVKTSAADWGSQSESACALVAMGSETIAWNESADRESVAVQDLIIGEPVLVYGEWGGSAEEGRIDLFQAALVARGANFERTRGPVLSFSTEDGEFTLGGAGTNCISTPAAQRVSATSDTLMLRQEGNRVVAVAPEDILTCTSAEAEGVRVASDELRAFAVVLRPQRFTGILYPGDSDLVQRRLTLQRSGASTLCLAVNEETQFTWWAYWDYWGSPAAWYEVAAIEDLLAKEVTVSGLLGSNGCINAERVTYIE